MAGTITALKRQKRRPDRVNVYLDGRYAFSLPEVEAAWLRRGQALSDEEIGRLVQRDEFDRAYNLALAYLSYRPRSRTELQTYLRGKAVAEETIVEVLARLEEAALVDDAAFARFWVGNREQFRPKGPAALRHELRCKGIADATIAEVLGELDVEESAYRAALKQARRLAGVERPVFFRRLSAYLARRGFGYETAREVCERVWEELRAEA